LTTIFPTSHRVEQLYHDYSTPLTAYLTRLVGDRSIAEELCQDAFVRVIANWAQHRADASDIAWLYRIATNRAYDHLRRQRRIHFTSLSASESFLTGKLVFETQVGDQEAIRDTLAQLPHTYRTALVLHDYAGHSIKQIAAAMDCTPNAIKMRLHRARKRFRQLLPADA
jgi:RNA polymerase sigma-70 factor (ECF subfamily)